MDRRHSRHFLAGRSWNVVSFISLIAAALLLAQLVTASCAPERRRLLIYYANETSLTASQSPNYKAVLEALLDSGTSVGPGLARFLQSDVELYRSVVRQDQTDLQNAAREERFDLAVFTNEMTLDGRFLYFNAQTSQTQSRSFPALTPLSDAILATYPLARLESFKAALASVFELYPRDTLDVVLISASHGSTEMALIPRVNTDLTVPHAREELIRQLREGPSGAAFQWAKLQGIEKTEYWSAIREVGGRAGVRFPLVFRQSCLSGPSSWRELVHVPTTVEYIAHSGMQNMNMLQINYREVFAGIGAEADWIETFKSRIEGRHVYVQSWTTLWVWPLLNALASINPAIYFVPLILWALWIAAVIIRKGLRKSSAESVA